MMNYTNRDKAITLVCQTERWIRHRLPTIGSNSMMQYVAYEILTNSAS